MNKYVFPITDPELDKREKLYIGKIDAILTFRRATGENVRFSKRSYDASFNDNSFAQVRSISADELGEWIRAYYVKLINKDL